MSRQYSYNLTAMASPACCKALVSFSSEKAEKQQLETARREDCKNRQETHGTAFLPLICSPVCSVMLDEWSQAKCGAGWMHHI